ncbi:MAG: hypothetical protein Kilf2KO_16920 [Rhodospirillales bacterium]
MTQSLYQKIADTVEGFTSLKVTTRVVEGDTRELSTEVNLVTGDATFLIHKDFVPDPEKLAALHAAQVAESREIVARTVEALATLAEKVGDKVEGYIQSQ